MSTNAEIVAAFPYPCDFPGCGTEYRHSRTMGMCRVGKWPVFHVSKRRTDHVARTWDAGDGRRALAALRSIAVRNLDDERVKDTVDKVLVKWLEQEPAGTVGAILPEFKSTGQFDLDDLIGSAIVLVHLYRGQMDGRFIEVEPGLWYLTEAALAGPSA